jgi:hypothetical protein
MPSPFPGMNPYLEHPRIWEDFHLTFMAMMREALIPQVVPKYFVRIQERMYLHEPDQDENLSLRISDVSVTQRRGGKRPARTPSATATIAAPIQITLPELVKMRIAYLEVFQRDGERVVTTIELLSPSNKSPGEDRNSYLTKRKELLVSGVNFVELDLLRAGVRMPLSDLASCAYYALVFRPSQKPKADVWPIQLREKLPTIPIPLAARDPEARLDLRAVLDRVYDSAGFEHDIYRRKPDPPLSAEDTAWAKGLIPKKHTTPR